MAPNSAFETNIVEQKVKTLVNAQLKAILKRENLLVSGLKAAMQQRIVDPIVREATRDTIECKITLKPDVVDRLVSEPNLRAMIFCASEPISHFSKVDVSFPHQVEIKVNLDEVKANLKGLKNRAGSTRPADITNLLRKRAHYDNSMTLTYALTHKRFFFVVSLVRQHLVEELVAKLKSGKTISKDQVVREMPFVDITYVDDILKSTPKYIDQVTVEPDGKWSRIAEPNPPSRAKHSSSSEDEDLVEIQDPPRITAVKNETTNGSISMRTPPTSSREQSATSSVPPPSIGTKRSASAFIDLTSDDEDEGDQRYAKKPAMPAYLNTPTYSSPGNGLGSFGPYSGNPPTKPTHAQRVYPYR
ncbi:MAG: hypothetical protein Q9168_000994 [Polycauliona sp. 1 TL-2023]